jgi:cobaltochelatase CobS
MSTKINEAETFASTIRNANKTLPAGLPDELVVDPFFQEDPVVARVIEFAIMKNKNLLIVGPTGCGKSCLAINVLARMKERGEIFSCDGEVSVDNLIGKLLVTVDKSGNSMTSPAPGAALRAYVEGKKLLLEEVDMAVPDILASLHRIMEINQQFYVCNIGAQEIIPKNKRFSVIATANTIGTGEDTFMYAGTKPLNQAFMNRFSLTIKMGYLDSARETKVLVNKTGIDQAIAMKLVAVANDVRDAADPKRMRGAPGAARLVSVVSTRDCIEWADAIVGMGLKPKDAAEYAFLSRISETDQDIIRTFISNRII